MISLIGNSDTGFRLTESFRTDDVFGLSAWRIEPN